MPKKVISTQMPDTSVIDNPIILGQTIKAKRTSTKMKMIDCASLCGVGINTLSRIENGNPNSTLASVFAVLNGLGIRLNMKDLSSTLSKESEWV